jgi:hypothetical protein
VTFCVIIDMTGQRVGRLLVERRAPGRSARRSEAFWHCQCDCGNTIDVRACRLRGASATRSCGCLRGKYPRLTKPATERFWQKVPRLGADDCWEWQASRNPKGYGQFNVGNSAETGRCVLAHRVAYELEVGAAPQDLLVLHVCDNPPCCNPAHLFTGTNEDNMRDKWLKGRGRGPLQLSQVIELKRLAAEGADVEDLSVRFKVMPYSVVSILKGRTWSEVA